LVVLVAMAVLIGGDRAAAAIAGYQITDRVETELAAHQVEYGSLAVDVADWPFLVHVVTGKLDEISISMTDLRASAGAAPAVSIASVDVVATGVRFKISDVLLGAPAATAQQIVGTALIRYASLEGLVTLPGLSLADIHFSESKGALRFEALGALAPVQATAKITVEKGRLRIRLSDARFDSNVLPELGREVLNQILDTTIDLAMPDLPLGLALQSVTPGPDGVSISIVGRDVPLTAS
jgi:hypothetical protein